MYVYVSYNIIALKIFVIKFFNKNFNCNLTLLIIKLYFYFYVKVY